MKSSTARPVLILAAVLGVAADLLVRDGPGGLGFALWIAALAVGALALAARIGRKALAEPVAWLAAAVIFAAAMAWRQSDPLQGLDLLATATCLAMAAIATRVPDWSLGVARVRDAIWPLTTVARTTAAGILPVVFRSGLDARSLAVGKHDTRAIARAVVISAMILALFGALLLHADPLLANLLAIPQFDIGQFISHLFIVGFFAWIVGGWSRAAFDDEATTLAPDQFGFTLSTLDISMSLGALNILFAAFVGTQLAWFFGGDAYLQAHTGLTAATYARRGFFEVVWVALLVVPLLLGTRAVIGTDLVVRRRHTLLSLPLTALLGAMMLSAALRMRLYVSYYGLTTDRFYSLVFMAWLAVVLALIAFTELRDRGRWLLAGATVSGFVALAALNVANPDVIIARVNIDRAASRSSAEAAGLDIVYLSKLGGDALDITVAAVLSDSTTEADAQCAAARTLISRWGPASRRALRYAEPNGWRVWNAGAQHGLTRVDQSNRELQAVISRTCPTTNEASIH